MSFFAQHDIKLWPFKVVNVDDHPEVSVEYLGETKRFKPEEISSMVLMKMKQTAEDFLGHPVHDAVVTGTFAVQGSDAIFDFD